MPQILLPNNWKPRDYQMPAWLATESGIRYFFMACHRRYGKDEIALHRTAVAAHERIGGYWHMLPQASQARKAIWEAINPHTGKKRIDEAFPVELRKRTLNNEMFIEFKCGSIWQVVGSDNFNSLVGSPPIGLVSSEHALSNPKAWSYLRPILVENGGWAMFISTYRGKNHFWELGEAAKDDPDWHYEVSPVSKTHAVPKELLDKELAFMIREMGHDAAMAMYRQEWECDPDAAIVGAFYAGELARAVTERRVSSVPFDSILPVYTFWDLGLDDATAIWWAQFSGKEIRLLKYQEFHEPLQAVATKVMEIGTQSRYAYKQHVLPHDAAAREMTTGRTREQALRGILGNIAIMPQDAIADGINATRSLMDRMWFDQAGTKDGFEALKNYCRDYDEKNKIFRDRPLHNWASHGCLIAGSLVETESGLIPIESVVSGDKVVTPMGHANVEWSGVVKRTSSLIKLTLADGQNITMTPEHKVFTTRGLVRADAMRYDDAVITGKGAACLKLANAKQMGYRAAFTESFGASRTGCGLEVSMQASAADGQGFYTARPLGAKIRKYCRLMGIGITSLLTIGRSGVETPDAQSSTSMSSKYTMASAITKTLKQAITRAAIQRPNTCTGLFGYQSVALSPMGITYTTSMRTNQTTELTTLPPFPLATILGFMRQQTSGLEAKKTSDKSGLLAKKLSNGTQAPMASLGTKLTASLHGLIGKCLRFPAIIAESLSRRSAQTEQSFATGIVSLERINCDNVPVYDLTVTHDHCYYANGMLVSNSDAMRQLALYYKESAGISGQQQHRERYGKAPQRKSAWVM